MDHSEVGKRKRGDEEGGGGGGGVQRDYRDRDRDYRGGYDNRGRGSYQNDNRRDYYDDRGYNRRYDDRDRRGGGGYHDDRGYNNRDYRRDDRYDSRRDERDRRDYRGDGDYNRDRRYEDDRSSQYYNDGKRGDNSMPPPSTTVASTPPPPLQPPKDPEQIEREREEERKKEQEKLEEETRKRRERVEAWRKEKLAAEEKAQAAAAASAEVTTPAASSTATPTPAASKWNLEDEDQEDTTASAAAGSSKMDQDEEEEDPLDAFMNNLAKKEYQQQQQQLKQQATTPTTTTTTTTTGNNTASTTDTSSPISTNGNTTSKPMMIIKPITKGDIIEGDESEVGLEEEDEEDEDQENGEEKEVKKGKKEILSTDHSKMNYIDFEKDFYVEVPILQKMSETEVSDYRFELGIKITGKNCPKPIQTWAQCGLSEKIHALLRKYNYEKPTAIQAQTIPAIMSGRDIIGIARTGSGKTLAFLLPMFRHVMAQEKPKQGEGMVGLIMSPTRELALQIYSECKKFSKVLGLRVCCVYGGANIGEQIADLKRGADIVVCTPGRMIDILCANNKRITNLKRVSFVVLDEADRMFDLGFGPQIMCVIDNVRPDRQTVMFSATFPFKVEQVARKILTRPLEIIAGGRSIVCSDVEQVVEVRPEETRVRRLLDLLSTWYHKGQILIFTNKQDATDNLYRSLSMAGYQCLSLHGSKDQTDRDETISDFKNKVKTILIATPLASRGLDVKDLNLVVNFDCPDHLEDYVHRVGRTGRAGNKGTAYTFITPEEERFAPSIAKALEQSGAKIPEELTKLCNEYQKKREEGKEVLVAGSGFTGRGHKFDAAEEAKKKEERKKQRRAYGIDEDEEEDETKPLEDITTPPPTTSTDSPITGATASPTTSTTATATTGATTPAAGTTTTVGVDLNTAAPLLGTDPSMSAGQQALSQIFGGSAPQMKAEDAIKALQLAAAQKAQKMQQAAQLAAAQAAAIANANTPASFSDELEINDYSQQARWKVTHKDSLLHITEMTQTAITTKGTFFPPGKTVPAGEKKLYLYIEGPSEAQIRTAKTEIKKILEEIQLISHNDKGKYSVF